MDRPFIPYGRQSLTEDDVSAVVDVLRSEYWTTGPAVPAFEREFSAACGEVESIATSNGTTALHLAALAAGVGPDSCVIVPDITFIATANGARYTGAEVVLSDVSPQTGLLGPEQLEVALETAGRPVQAVFAVHLAGQTVDMQALREVCDSQPNGKSAYLIEDACHAVGSLAQDGTPVGSCLHSDLSIFSFHPVKTVAAGEGGMVTCKSPEMAERLRQLRSHGITRDPDQFRYQNNAVSAYGAINHWYYEALETGFNYRLTDIQAALGLSQLKRLASFKAKRQELISRYEKHLVEAPLEVRNSIRLIERVENCDPCWHLCVVQIDFEKLKIDKSEMVAALRDRSIGSQVHYVPLHMHPVCSPGHMPAVSTVRDLSGATRYYDSCLSLPLYQDLSLSDVDYVCDNLISLLKTSLV